MSRRALGERLEAALQRSWWQTSPGLVAWLLWPLSRLYGLLASHARRRAPAVWQSPCPVIVVGNLVVGGAGKTPVVISLVRALRDAGYRPGVVSRGHGRRTTGVLAVQPELPASDVGDEPALIFHATGAPVFVGEQRVSAALRLLESHPEVNVLISDDGLQHSALARSVEIWVFDERGIGNGMLLPAGPLRQPLPEQVPAQALVLYNADRPSTPLPGPLARRKLGSATPLARWRGDGADPAVSLASLRGRPLVAIAGIATPRRFFDMLRAEGLEFDALPLPDHAPLEPPPWPAGTGDVLCTEKDATKLDPARCGTTRVWVVPLDLQLPPQLLEALFQRLALPRTP